MTVQLVITKTDGTVVTGLDYRLDPSQPVQPLGDTYHLETATGWVDVNVADIQTITPYPLRST